MMFDVCYTLVGMSLHTDRLSWFLDNKLFTLTPAYCVLKAKKQQRPILVFGLTWPGLKPMTYRTRVGTLTITQPVYRDICTMH